MNGYALLNSLSLAVYTFGALAFSALSVSYWWARRDAGGSRVLAVFTVACAAAFLLGLAREFDSTATLAVAQDLVTGILPALLLHLVFPERGWSRRWLLAAFYGVALAVAVAGEFSDRLDDASAWVLGAAGLLGLAGSFAASRDARRRWNQALLVLTVAAAFANLAVPGPMFALLPDYLFLAFFAVALYYQERLAFFDVLVKRGAFFALGLAALCAVEPLRHALLLMPLWMAAPWIYGRLARGIERTWLQRPFSNVEAERKFLRDVQAAASETELAARAEQSLAEIFPQGPSFLSGDRALEESLDRTLEIVRQNTRLRWLTSRAELKALRAQINPHFLFNALNAIAGLIREQPELAEDTVEHLAEVFRYTLRKSENEWVRLDEEIDFVRAYLRVEQARFGERLEVEIDVASGVGSVPVPAMSIQPLVENAIKHGASAVERRGRIRVRADLAAGLLRVEVEDNGPGFAAGAPQGHGLRNVAERLQGYYGGAARLVWENLAEGARVCVEIPPVREKAACGY
jgi:signal transduction histidine kinase